MKELLKNNYGIEFIEKKLIQRVEDDVYFLKDKEGKKYKFKVYKDLTTNRENGIKQIYNWTDYLSDRLSIPVSRIISSIRGNEFILINSTGNIRGCLFEWIDWEIIEEFNEDYAYKIGSYLRAVHEETKNYEGIFDNIKKINSEWINQVAKKTILKAAERNHCQSLGKLEKNLNYLSTWLDNKEQEENFGLIHSDLHRKNIIHREEKLGFIDYDDTIYCSYLLDIATIINEFEDNPSTSEMLRESLLNGYGIQKKNEYDIDIYLYKKIADIIYADWVFGNRNGENTVFSTKIKYGLGAIKSLTKMKTAANNV